MFMRRTIATLAAVVAGVAAFGGTAGPAAADVPNPNMSGGAGSGNWSFRSARRRQAQAYSGSTARGATTSTGAP
jgi:hypothetical protein